MSELVFQNYHKHSERTNPIVSDSTVKNEEYAKAAVERGHQILASTEHGYQGRYVECYDLAKEYNLKFLFGTEAYWVKDRTAQDNANCHIWIGAKNENGRKWINDILSEANLTGFYYRPRIDLPLIFSLPKDDVWVTTACIAGWKYEEVDGIFRSMFDYFGKNFFLEVQYHNTPKQKELNKRILKLHEEWKCPLIMGCDSHYITEEQAEARDDFLVSKGMNYEDEVGWFLDYPTGDTAYSRFAEQNILSHSQIVDAIANTNTFLDVEEYDSEIFNEQIKMPSLHPDWTQEQKDAEYERLVWQGYDAYKSQIAPALYPLYEKEIASEIAIVKETKMADYFIDNYYIIKKGKENGGWLTKSGRGSAVSFITNKLLGFTEVDRIAAKVKMYPERFMSAARIIEAVTLPDIDFNVAPVEPFARAQKEILGEEHAYPMISYGTFQKSAAWKLYAKAKGVPFDVANAVSEQLKRYEIAVKHAEEDERDSIDVQDFIEPQYVDIFNDSKEYMGLITSWSIAPCSYLLYDKNIRREIGLIKIKDHVCCLMDGAWAEKKHFLKNDLLKVSVVELIYKSYHAAGIEPPDVNTLLQMAPPEDDCWQMYAKGCVKGLNQVEQPGTSARVGKYAPKNISEMCAFVAAIRPGFKSMYKTFESREPFSYGVKQFDDLIQTEEMPNSFLLYQEHIMTALNYAGIPMSECYTAIKNIAKKRAEKVLAYKDKFISGLTAAIIKDGKPELEAKLVTEKLWQIIEDSAFYSFNASHSYCVSLDSLYSAWIKAHYPLAFYETLLQITESKGDKDKLIEIKREAEDYFNISFPSFKFGQDNRGIRADTENNSLTNSLTSIKNMPKATPELLWQVAQTNPQSMIDVLAECSKLHVSDAAIQMLAKIGYFDTFGNIPEIMRILELFDFFNKGTAKTVSKKKDLAPEFFEIIKRYSTDTNAKGEELASYTITNPEIAQKKAELANLKKVYKKAPSESLAEAIDEKSEEVDEAIFVYEVEMLREMESHILSKKIADLDYANKIQNQIEILGYVDLYSGKEEDRRKLFVEEIRPMKDKKSGDIWCYRIDTRSIGSGKASSLTVPIESYKEYPIGKHDIITVPPGALKKNRKGYWYLYFYDKVYA